MDEVSEREKALASEIRKVYNSGNAKKAVEMSINFLKEFPESLTARYLYSVMHGDYSAELGLTQEESKRCREIANNGFQTLINDPDFKKWSWHFQFGVRNEYYWFFELHQEQYDLGIETIATSEDGHYSACVGASMLALKFLKERNIPLAEEWANKSFFHFEKYEKYMPDWYNINYFSSQSLACLGKYEEALLCYKDMYRKQKSQVNEAEVAEFVAKMEEWKNYRK
nr:hypothetical protein BHI3_08640 [Bacteriovorax sp. HI3]